VPAGPHDETLDELLRGRLRLWQPRRGYRLSVDPLLLADFVTRACGPRLGRVCDLGAGVGVVGLALAQADPAATGLLVELQPRLAGLARRNVAANAAAPRLEVHEGDLRDLPARHHGRYDLVVSNPPYRPVGAGKPNPDREKALANLELECRLDELVAAARLLLAPRGRFALVHDAGRLGAVMAALGDAGLYPERLRLVHPRADAGASRLLVLARRTRGPGPLHVAPPLVLHEPDGSFTPEAATILGEALPESTPPAA
jgi:tRNA1Val (adenine37-N6)-methyltransferase